MVLQVCGFRSSFDADGGFHGTLAEQILWLISLRWIAVAVVVVATALGTYLFPVLLDPRPLYASAAVLLACNLGYALFARFRSTSNGRAARFVSRASARVEGILGSPTRKDALGVPLPSIRRRDAFDTRGQDARDTTRRATDRRWTILAMVQMEVDLLVLTAVLHFSGGAANPFCLFYVFHVIIATIILPRNLSFAVGLTAIGLFGVLAANELNAGTILGHYPLQLSAGGGLWRNPVYGLAAFAAFACTVTIAQYLTRMIIARMASKEREAARNSNLLQAIINAMAEGLIFITADGQVVLCNPAARRWRQHGGPQGESIDGFPAALAQHIQALPSCRSGSGPEGTTITFRTEGPAQRFIEARSYPLTGPDGTGLGHVIVGQDLTEHKKLEADLLARTDQVTAINETLKMSQVRMAQREKMVALGQMAAGIAHEIGNPLTSLSSVVQYLSRKCADPELKELCGVVDHHVGRISAILRRMLSQARPMTSEYKWVDVNEVVENTLALIRYDKRAQGITIANAHSPDLPIVWLNPQNLEQCLLNIVINALDAMELKGTGYEHKLEVLKSVREEMVEIRIRDTGVGMSPEVCRRAFESFFTTKEISKGTGLGLFISYNLITEIDGTIELQSEPGVGTTAIVRIPVRPKKSLIAEPAPGASGTDPAKASNEPCY